MDKVAIYARYSTDKQDKLSLEDQTRLCERKAKDVSAPVVSRYGDAAQSGMSTHKRPQFRAMLEAARRGEFNTVIVESFQRAARDMEDLAGMYKRLTAYGVKLISVQDGEADAQKIAVHAMMGQMQVQQTSQMVRRRLIGNVARGKSPGTLTFGYDLVAGKKGDRVRNEEEANVIRRIFKLYANGVSPRVIAQTLTREGIPSPSGQPVWNHQTIITGSYGRGIISNPMYLGKLVWNTHRCIQNPDTGGEIRLPNPEKEWERFENPDWQIVPQDLWDAAQAVRRQRSTHLFGEKGGRKPRNMVARGQDKWLTGTLRCGACDASMRITQRNHSTGVVRVGCSASHKNGTCDHRKTYDLVKLKKIIFDNLRPDMIDAEQIKRMTKGYYEEFEKLAKTDDGKLEAAQREENTIKVQIERLLNTLMDVGNSPAISAKLEKKEVELVQAKEKIRTLSEKASIHIHPRAINAVVDRYIRAIGQLHDALTSSNKEKVEEAQLAFGNLIDRIVVKETPKRGGYAVEAMGHVSAAAAGGETFPPKRSAGKIIDQEGLSAYTDIGHHALVVLPVSQHCKGLIPLGHWRAVA